MTIGTNGSGTGYFTNGFAIIGGDVLSGASSVPVDTGYGRGATPQSGGIIPGTLPIPSGSEAVTAHAGGGKASATALDYGVTRVSTSATAANSVLLPYAFPGAVCFVANDGAQSIQIFGKGTDTIDAVATGTGNALAAAARSWFIGVTGAGDGSDAGTWVSLKGAKTS